MARCFLFFLIFGSIVAVASAQTPCNDTIVRIDDSICEGQEYTFGSHRLTHTGYYYDTIPRINSACDSVVILHLAVLELFTVRPTSTTYCHQPVGYDLHGFGGSFFHHWTSLPEDTNLILQQYSYKPFVNPTVPTTYTLTIDYRASSPQCPSTGSIMLNPVQQLQPALRVTPDVLTFDNMELTVTDCSSGNDYAYYGEGWAGRNWYFNGEKYTTGNQSEVILVRPWWGDTIEVMMESFTPTCFDTVIRRIPFRRLSLYFPNVIVPSNGDKFVPQLLGVLQYELWIFNRYGMQVFHTTDPAVFWDGTKGGQPCPQGSYVYKCRYTTIDTPTGSLTLTGTVSLVR